MRLATFVHISDLHFGDIDPDTGDAICDERLALLWKNSGCFDGLLGHSYRALERLEKFFRRIRTEEDAQLIVTGDLTCVGKREQYEIADRYLGARLDRYGLGLSIANWMAFTIPGNHDQWPGLDTCLGEPTDAFRERFSGLPFVSSPIHLPSYGRQVYLQFIGINSDADVSPYGPNRGFARGSFCSQLSRAAELMGIPNEIIIRVLLLHHSHAHQGFILGIEPASRQALETFIVEQDIAVILSGHTHIPYVRPFYPTHHGTICEVLEARCGTTLQRDTIPYEWKTVLGNRPSRELVPNTLLVHRLLEENDEVIWHAETHLRTPYTFQVREGLPSYRLRVWPRPL